MTQKRVVFTLALLTATLALPGLATAQCTPFTFGLYFADMKFPNPAFADINVAFFQPPADPTSAVETVSPPTPTTNADPSCAGFLESVLKVTIPNGCAEARIWLEYEGMPIGWTANVGDSPENNGFGGDFGGPESDAELQILDETLSVYSKALGPGTVDLLAQEDLGLTDGALEIVVRNQFVSWGPDFTALDTANSGLLYVLPDAGAPAGDENTFYLGVNRVIFGPGSRTGCGVRRVIVSFR